MLLSCVLLMPLPSLLEYHRATVHVPIVDEGNEHPVHMADACSDLIAEINSLQVGSNGVDGNRSVRFGARPVGATHISQTTLQSALTHSTKISCVTSRRREVSTN